ncbi:MAG: flagellar hook-associated protein FlgL [Candidatus Eremiobacteraeota bacterium]|nr:flagellar hook-associated protein FlgL [Candidatus Eremiobacteraeota bacterium]
MRISTDSVYQQQVASIDELNAQQALYAQQISSGKAVSLPGDDPQQIAQDLNAHTDIGVQTQVGQNLTNTSSQLTTVDSALASLTNVLQSARSLAIEGASDTNTPSQLQEIATQVYQLLQQSVGIGNTQYGGAYVFAGTATPSSAPVVLTGSPATAVTFTGNDVAQTQKLPNGQSLTTSVTLQQAFNYNASDGSPSVFLALQNLYNTLNNAQTTDESTSQVNASGQALSNATTFAQMTAPGTLITPLVPDSAGNVEINLSSSSAPSGVNINLTGLTLGGIVAAINAQTGVTGVTAAFDLQTQRLSLTSASNQPFRIQDVPSAGATNTGNFVAAFNLNNQADFVNNLSTQLGDIDHVTQAMLNSRAQVGSTLQQLAALSGVNSETVNNDTTVQSNIEDTNIPKVTTQFSLAQTALQAAYGTTSRLEQKDLFDYLS